MTNRSILAIALLTLLAAGCNNREAEAEGHTETHNRVSGMSESSAGLPKGRVEAGEKLANLKREATGQSCIDCHGPAGNAPIDGSYPLIGGQHSDYLAHALASYRIGRRDNALMKSQAETLTDQQIADLAAYFGSRPTEMRTLVNTDGNFTNVDSE